MFASGETLANGLLSVSCGQIRLALRAGTLSISAIRDAYLRIRLH